MIIERTTTDTVTVTIQENGTVQNWYGRNVMTYKVTATNSRGTEAQIVGCYGCYSNSDDNLQFSQAIARSYLRNL